MQEEDESLNYDWIKYWTKHSLPNFYTQEVNNDKVNIPYFKVKNTKEINDDQYLPGQIV